MTATRATGIFVGNGGFMTSPSGLLHDAALAAERFAKLAMAQLDHPSAPLAARVEAAREALLAALAQLPDQR